MTIPVYIERDGCVYATARYHGRTHEIEAVLAADGSVDKETTRAVLISNISKVMTNALRTERLTSPNNICDRVYVNKEIVREDFTVSYPQARRVLYELRKKFPSLDVDEFELSTSVGAHTAYRPPYTGKTACVYHFQRPSEVLLDSYGIHEGTYKNIAPWYGLKYDLEDGSVKLKVVLWRDSMDCAELPELPIGFKFFARIHHQDKTVDPLVDCYVTTTGQEMKEYCKRHGVSYPIDDDVEEGVVIWSVVFNADTKAIVLVKAYERVDIKPGHPPVPRRYR